MNEGYAELVIILICFVLAPAVYLAVALRPKPWRNVFRGSEAAVCLAFALDKATSLGLIGGGTKISYPGDLLAILRLAVYALVAILLWCRVSQIVRHRARDNDTRERFTKANAAGGSD